MSYGVGVERIFPLHSPRYEKIEVLTRGDVNRNRLFYLRDLRARPRRVDVQEEILDTQLRELRPPRLLRAPAAPAPKGKRARPASPPPLASQS